MKHYLIFIISLLLAAPSYAAKTKTKTAPRAKPKVEVKSAQQLIHSAEQKFMAYDFEGGLADLDEITDVADELAPQIEALESHLNAGQAMLERVQKIAVIDSLIVDKTDFFKAYNINPSAGTIAYKELLPADFESASATTVYTPENGARLLWGADTPGGGTQIMESALLADGVWEEPRALDATVNIPGAKNSNYPFVMTDGVTLYFASDDPETSLGGYDLYVSRFDGNNYLEPLNLGMPYNSPADDYLLAIDESTGLGWWATDRNHLADKLTIYIFEQTDNRSNYPIDTPNLASLAKLSSIAATQAPGADYSQLLDAVAATYEREVLPKIDFTFNLPDGTVLHNLDSITDEATRGALENYLDRLHEYEHLRTELDTLRSNYVKDSDTTGRIMELERTEQSMLTDLRRLSNMVVSAYTRK